MRIGKIIGNVWCERKVPEIKACRLHIIQPISTNGDKVEHPLVVADPENLAGCGDIVVYVTGTDAAQAFSSGVAPVNASVVKLVDAID
jgi:ethanolamine utilization protein EutN